MKKLSTFFAAIILSLAVSIPLFASTQIVVLHTNDHHGQVLQTSDKKGGLEYESTYVKKIRAEYKNVLLLDAGDINMGTALSNMFLAEPDILAYNKMGVDAMTFGNHEFDNNQEVIENQMKMSNFPWLSANIKNGNAYLGKPYITKEFDGIKIGIFGLTTLRTLTISGPSPDLKFENEIKAAKKIVKILQKKEKCDYIILLAHLGDISETDSHITSIKLAEKVKGIDLIIDGHSHSYFAEEKYSGGIPIVTANEKTKYVGTTILDFDDNKKLSKFSWKPQEISSELFEPDPEITELLKPYVQKAQESLSEVVMTTTEEFEFGPKLTRYKEMASGDFLCDAMLAFVKRIGSDADFAITNGGGIRYSLPKGDVTREDILTMLPFENYIYVVTLSGADVQKLFDFVGSIRQGAGAFAQVSKECRYTITYDEEGNGKISGLTINGKEIDVNKTYKIVTHNYMAGGGDGYEVLKNSTDTFNTSTILSDAFIEYAKNLGTVTPKTDGRITVINGKY